jgi:hypothetical protein
MLLLLLRRVESCRVLSSGEDVTGVDFACLESGQTDNDVHMSVPALFTHITPTPPNEGTYGCNTALTQR